MVLVNLVLNIFSPVLLFFDIRQEEINIANERINDVLGGLSRVLNLIKKTIGISHH